MWKQKLPVLLLYVQDQMGQCEVSTLVTDSSTRRPQGSLAFSWPRQFENKFILPRKYGRNLFRMRFFHVLRTLLENHNIFHCYELCLLIIKWSICTNEFKWQLYIFRWLKFSVFQVLLLLCHASNGNLLVNGYFKYCKHLFEVLVFTRIFGHVLLHFTFESCD